MRSRSVVAAVSIAGCLLLAAPAAQAEAACDVSWDGGAGTRSWGDAANWSGDALPSVTQHACIADIPGTAPVLVDTSVVVGSFESLEDISITNNLLLEDEATPSTARVL